MSEVRVRRRRFLRRVVAALGVLILAPTLYVGSWSYCSWGLIAGTPRPGGLPIPNVVYVPPKWYTGTDLPGTGTMDTEVVVHPWRGDSPAGLLPDGPIAHALRRMTREMHHNLQKSPRSEFICVPS